MTSPKETEAPVARLPLLTGAAIGPLGVPRLPVGGQVAVALTLLALVSAPCVVLAQ